MQDGRRHREDRGQSPLDDRRRTPDGTGSTAGGIEDAAHRHRPGPPGRHFTHRRAEVRRAFRVRLHGQGARGGGGTDPRRRNGHALRGQGHRPADQGLWPGRRRCPAQPFPGHAQSRLQRGRARCRLRSPPNRFAFRLLPGLSASRPVGLRGHPPLQGGDGEPNAGAGRDGGAVRQPQHRGGPGHRAAPWDQHRRPGCRHSPAETGRNPGQIGHDHRRGRGGPRRRGGPRGAGSAGADPGPKPRKSGSSGDGCGMRVGRPQCPPEHRVGHPDQRHPGRRRVLAGADTRAESPAEERCDWSWT